MNKAVNPRWELGVPGASGVMTGRGSGVNPQAATAHTTARAADASQAVLQVPMTRTTNTRTPDRAIPSPTPPNPHPARNWDCPRRCALQSADGDHEDEGTGNACDEPQGEPDGSVVGSGHERQSRDEDHQRRTHHRCRAHRAGNEDSRERADEVPEVVRCRQGCAERGGQTGLRVHQRQNRCVHESTDSHARRQRSGSLDSVHSWGDAVVDCAHGLIVCPGRAGPPRPLCS